MKLQVGDEVLWVPSGWGSVRREPGEYTATVVALTAHRVRIAVHSMRPVLFRGRLGRPRIHKTTVVVSPRCLRPAHPTPDPQLSLTETS